MTTYAPPDLLTHAEARRVTNAPHNWHNYRFWQWLRDEGVTIYGVTHNAVKYGDLIDRGLVKNG